MEELIGINPITGTRITLASLTSHCSSSDSNIKKTEGLFITNPLILNAKEFEKPPNLKSFSEKKKKTIKKN